jgi:hypothetical protein
VDEIDGHGDMGVTKDRSGRRSFLAGVRNSRQLPVLVGMAGLLAMPTLLPYVGTGTDPSWSIALNLATARHLHFGRDIVFTFGPLGFLASPGLSVPRLGVIAMVLRFVLSALLGWLVARSLLRRTWWPLALAVTWYMQWAVVGGSSGGAEAILIPVLLLALGLLDALSVRTRPVGRAVLAACGWVAATSMLTKFDSGLLCLLICAGFVVGEKAVLRRSWRGAAESVGFMCAGFVASLLAWWVLLGQSLVSIGAWIATSVQVFLGYESAMVADSPLAYSARHSFFTVVAVVVLAGLCACAGADRRRSVIIWILSMFALAVYAKQSFTRYDNGHLQRLYVAAALMLIAAVGSTVRGSVVGTGADAEADAEAAAKPSSRAKGAPASGAAGQWLRPMLITVTLAASVYFAHVAADLVSAPKPDLTSATSVLRLVVSGSRRNAVVTRQRTLLPKELAVPAEVRTALAEGSVHIEPAETSIAWLFPEIRWKPLPVFQSYSAYTPSLDDLNARAYAKRGGPDMVLYEGGFRVDFRLARFESPAAQVAFVCNFRPRVLTDRWQVFVRRSDGSACAPDAVALTTMRTRIGARVELPAVPDDSIVVASFSGLAPTLAERVRSAVLRAPKYWFVMAQPAPGEPAHRFVAGDAEQPHIVSLPKCLRGAWSTYDTRTYGSFFLRNTEFPRTDGALGRAVTVRLQTIRYKCPS